MNAARIEIAQPAINSTGLGHAGEVFLPVLPGQNLTGFSGLFTGFIEQNESETNAEAAAEPVKRVGNTAVLQATTAKEKGAKAANTKDAEPSIPIPSASAAITSPAALFAMGDGGCGWAAGHTSSVLDEKQPSDADAPPMSSGLPDSPAVGTTASQLALSNTQLSSTPNIAFALQMTWQPARTVNTAMTSHAALDVVLPKAPEPANHAPLDLVPAKAPESPNSVELPPTDSFKDAPATSQAVDQPAHSSSSLSQQDFSVANSKAQDEPAFRSPESMQGDRPWNVSSGFRPQSQRGPTNQKSPAMNQNSPATTSSKTLVSPETTAMPDRVNNDNQLRGVTAIASSVSETAAFHISQSGPEFPAPQTESTVEASASHTAGQEQSLKSESDTPAPTATSGTTTAVREGRSQNDSQNTADRNPGNSESEEKAPRTQVPEKAPQIQNSHERAGGANDGVLLNRPTEPNAAQTQGSKGSAAESAHSAASPQPVETATTVQPRPIREISLRLAVAASDKVDVQVAQRGGKVQVAVHTSDQDLAKSLQTNLGELIGRLEEKGFKTEAWTPGGATHGTSMVMDPSKSANSQGQSDNCGSRGGQQDPQQGQQQSNQRQQGRWKAQLEETLSMPNTLTYEEEQA